jgi:asparagine synthase (glutamine-hydrolysing)
MKLRGKEGKYILKKAVHDLLPQDIIYRKKQGFPTPLRDWLLHDRAKVLVNYLRDRDGILAAYVNGGFLEDLLRKHYSGQIDATDRIWRLLNLQLWGDMYLTGRRDEFWEGLMPVSTHTARPA